MKEKKKNGKENGKKKKEDGTLGTGMAEKARKKLSKRGADLDAAISAAMGL